MKFSGVKLRQARDAAKLTQLELGRRVGASGLRPESIISQYERGERCPSGVRVVALARELGVTAEYFYTYGPRKKT